jgi:hypothetical protein
MRVSNAVIISACAFSFMYSTFTFAQKEATHQTQISNPSKLHVVVVESGVTKIVAASTRDLNAIHTPFEQPTIVKNAQFEYKTLNNVLYFQPNDKKPFGLYITEKDDKDAPIYKLTVVPSEVPIGQQIKLKPKNTNYFNQKTFKQDVQDAPDYPSFLISLLADTAKHGSPKSFSKDFAYDKSPYYIGNVLVSPSYRTVNSNYEVIVLEATNRNNVTIQLTESDFSTLTPETGLIQGKEPEQVAALGFYPHIVLEPGAVTNVYLVRLKTDD